MNVTIKETDRLYSIIKELGVDLSYTLLELALSEYYEVKNKKDIEDYKKKYPNYCERCGGHGGFSDNGDFYTPPSFDPCQKCVDNNICPRCGGKEAFDIENSDNTICKHCGFDCNNPTDCCPDGIYDEGASLYRMWLNDIVNNKYTLKDLM